MTFEILFQRGRAVVGLEDRDTGGVAGFGVGAREDGDVEGAVVEGKELFQGRTTEVACGLEEVRIAEKDILETSNGVETPKGLQVKKALTPRKMTFLTGAAMLFCSCV